MYVLKSLCGVVVLSQRSVAAGDGVIGFRLIDRAKIALNRIYGADRERDPEHDGNHVGTINSTVITLLVIAETRFDTTPRLDAIFR